jgi:hypothetical protein
MLRLFNLSWILLRIRSGDVIMELVGYRRKDVDLSGGMLRWRWCIPTVQQYRVETRRQGEVVIVVIILDCIFIVDVCKMSG